METWLPIPGFEGFYEACSDGRIRSVARMVHTYSKRGGSRRPIPSRVLKHADNGKGYKHVRLCVYGVNYTRYIHILVALTFLGPRPEGMDVCHKNGVSADNRFENLKYATPQENMADRIVHGTDDRGEKNRNSLLTDEKVRYIRASKESAVTLSKMFGVGKTTIRYARKMKSWKHVE